MGGSGPGQNPPRLFRFGALAHRVPVLDPARRFPETTHQVEHRVDDSPGEVAPEGGEQHGVDPGLARAGDAERSRDGQDHDQAEKDLGRVVDRIQDAPQRQGAQKYCLQSNARRK